MSHRGGQEEEELAPFSPLDRREGQDHRDRGADQDEGVPGRQVDGQWVGQIVVGQGPVVRLERLDLSDGSRLLEPGFQGLGLRGGQFGDQGVAGVVDLLDDLLGLLGGLAGCGVEDGFHLGIARTQRLDEDAFGLSSPRRGVLGE